MSKYGNKKIVIDGYKFDSLHEAERYCELKLLVRGKVITDLELQKKFILLPTQYEDADGNGRVIERAVTYIADFVYKDLKTGQTVVEDAKGCKTKEYILKRKMMYYFRNIRIREV